MQDFLPYDVEMFQNDNINITGFQIINREVKEYWNLKKFITNESFKIEKKRKMNLEVHFYHHIL